MTSVLWDALVVKAVSSSIRHSFGGYKLDEKRHKMNNLYLLQRMNTTLCGSRWRKENLLNALFALSTLR